MVLNNANNLDEEILRKVDEIIVMSEGKIVERVIQGEICINE